MSDDFLRSAWNYVMNSGALTSYVWNNTNTSGIIGSDATFPNGWIFRGLLDGNPLRNVEDTSKCAIVLTYYDQWSAQTRFHSTKFPRLNVLIYADPTRGTDGKPQKLDAEEKVNDLWRVIDTLFHDSGNQIHSFAGYPIVSTLEGVGLSITDVPNGDGVVRGSVSYEVTTL